VTPVLSADYSRPDQYVMPAAAQDVALWVAVAGAAAVALYALYLAVTRRSLLPLAFVVGAFATVAIEPLADFTGNAVHSQVGQYTAFTVEGAPIPWHILITYGFYAGAGPILLFDRIRAQSLTPRFWWRAYVVGLIGVGAIEQVPVAIGLWHYYGYQPFTIGGMPLFMIFANAACVTVPILLVYKLYPVLTGWRQLLGAVIIPVGSMGGWACASLAAINALGTDTEHNHLVVQLSSLATVGLSLFVTWMTIVIVHWEAPAAARPERAEEPAAAPTG
jgi:hypothetical protein